MRGPVHGMRAPGRGFIPAEMILLLLMLVAFLAGVVLLVERGVSTFDSGKGDSSLAGESERVFEGLEAIIGSARAVSLEQPGLDPGFNRGRLVLVAELDGSGPGGGTGEPDLSENEVVLVRVRPSRPRELQVLVAGGTGGAGETVLSSLLDWARPAPFSVEYMGLNGEKIGPAAPEAPVLSVGSIRITLWLRSGDRSERFSRLIVLDEPLLAAPVEPGGVF
jgi:hypothetical protein